MVEERRNGRQMKEVEERVQICRRGVRAIACSALHPCLGSQIETSRLSVVGSMLGMFQAGSSGELTLENGGSIVHLHLGKYDSFYQFPSFHGTVCY